MSEEAWRWQAGAIKAGDLLIWTICENPKDFPGLFTARPFSARTGRPCDFVMTHATLDGIRDLLPHGLTLLQRDPSDDPVIVESWI